MLKLYSNIEEYRKRLGLSQEDLAELLGYKSGKSMISKIENGKVDLAFSQIIKCANVLKVDPDILMGFDSPSDSTLNKRRPDELELLKKYNTLNPDGQKKVRGYVSDLAGNVQYKKDTTGVKEKTG